MIAPSESGPASFRSHFAASEAEMFEFRHGSTTSERLGTLPSAYTASVQPLTIAAKPSAAAMRPVRSDRGARSARWAVMASFVAICALRTRPAAASDMPVSDSDPRPATAEVPLATIVDMTTLNPCFDRVSLTDAIEEWLERSTVDARLRIHVTTDNGIPAFSIRLGDDPPLVRTFEDRPGDCEAERDAIALSIALAIDSLSSQAIPIRQPIWNIGFSGVLTTAWTDRVNWGGGLHLGARAAWHFEPQLGAVIVLSQDQPLHVTPESRLDTRLILARGSGCFTTPLFESVTALACAGVMVGPSRVSATGLADSRSQTNLFAAGTGTLEFRLRFSRNFGLHVAADLLVSLRRGTLRVDDADGKAYDVDSLPSVLGMFRVGPSAFF